MNESPTTQECGTFEPHLAHEHTKDGDTLWCLGEGTVGTD